MKFTGRHVSGGLATVVVLGVLYRGYSVLYASPRDALLDSISSQRASLERYEDDSAGMRDLEARRDAVIATTLGGQVDQIEHQFRSRLKDLATDCGLVESEIVVSSGDAKALKNPAEKSVTKVWKRLFDEGARIGFITGSLKGVGTLDQVMRTIATLQVQPWAHRVDSISIRPVNGGEAFDFRVGVSTLFFPGNEPTEQVANVLLDAGAELEWAAIVWKNAFRRPPPDEPVVAVVPTPPVVEPTEDDPPTPPPPFHEWRMVGVWDGANAMGVIMAHTSNGRSRLIEPGQRVLGLKLVVATGERAEFEFEGKRFEVLQKQTLAERRELGQPRG